ncbi:STAS domain-containing protein [Nocardioides sp.]|uniref:STAS domain-containing protein n=1 Tax=Nocardioides sp. TaxID=35761 RepID=UPI0035297889
MTTTPEGAGTRLELLASGQALVALTGEIDLAVVPDLVTEFEYAIAQLSPHVVVDLNLVEFIDSSGLGALVRARRMAQERGGDVVLVGAVEQVREVLALTNLGELFTVFETVAEAVDALPAPPATHD